MNRTLRQRHRWMTALLALVLPVVFVAGLVLRPTAPAIHRLPVNAAPPVAGTALAAGTIELGNGLIDATLSLVAGTPRVTLTPQPGNPPMAPDVLVYWSTDSPANGKPPAGAYLIGAMAAERTVALTLPEPARRVPGRLVFYSLAQDKLFATQWPTAATDKVSP